MEKMKKKLGFGFMRLPMKGDEIDIAQTCGMVDEFLARGFNYFDVARGYLNSRAEATLRTCLTSRHPRESYLLTDKLSGGFFKTEADVRPLFEAQLADCGVDYFDFYLMHAQCQENYDHYKQCRAYEQAFQLKAEGKIRHVGLSFHDSAEFLNKILTEYPQIEIVQLQFNYLDYEDPAVQSKACYEVCVKHGKPVLVMEPVKGGRLTQLPEKAQEILDELHGGSSASYAIRFAAGFENIKMVLSGMSSLEQLKDNTDYMADFKPLNEQELNAIEGVRNVFRSMNLIPCTACRYCEAGCPQQIHIPDLFAVMNTKQTHKDWDADFYYGVHTANSGKASDCVECGQCEEICPQHLEIRSLLKQVGDDVVGHQKASGGQVPPAVLALCCLIVNPVLEEHLFQGLKGQHKGPLVFLGQDARRGPQPEHQVLPCPFPQGDLLDILHDIAAGLYALDVGLQIPHHGKALPSKIRAGAGAEAQVFAAGPILGIVPGVQALSAEIGNFILPEAVVAQSLHGGHIHICLGVIVRQAHEVLHVVQRGTFLYLQAVAAHVLRVQL